MATPTEQGHTHVEEDSGNEGGPGQTAHTSLTAFLTALKDTKKQSCSADRSFIQHDGYSSWQNVTHDEADGESKYTHDGDRDVRNINKAVGTTSIISSVRCRETSRLCVA